MNTFSAINTPLTKTGYAIKPRSIVTRKIVPLAGKSCKYPNLVMHGDVFFSKIIHHDSLCRPCSAFQLKFLQKDRNPSFWRPLMLTSCIFFLLLLERLCGHSAAGHNPLCSRPPCRFRQVTLPCRRYPCPRFLECCERYQHDLGRWR